MRVRGVRSVVSVIVRIHVRRHRVMVMMYADVRRVLLLLRDVSTTR